MEITFDPAKSARNIEFRGLSFEQVASRVHALVFSETTSGIRVISFRKANKREVNRYEQKTQA